MAVADDKSHAEEVNSVTKHDAEALRSNSIQHGDRAAQLLGDQRVNLTEEDVSFHCFHSSKQALFIAATVAYWTYTTKSNS